jgi:hypothetical protein
MAPHAAFTRARYPSFTPLIGRHKKTALKSAPLL